MTLVELAIQQGMESAAHYDAFLGALIGAGTSLLGGLFGRSDAKKRDKAAAEAAKIPQVSTTEHKVDAVGMVNEAIRAGFNPVTFLNAGGLGGFTTTTNTTTGHNAMAAVPTAPSFGSVLAGAAQTGFDIWRQDGQTAKQQAHEKSLVAMQLGPKGGGSSSSGRAYGAYAAGAPRPMSAAKVAVAGGLTVGKTSLGSPTVPVVGDSTITNPHHRALVDPTVRDAEMAETRYGDIAQEVFGVKNLLADLSYNITGVKLDEAWQSAVDGYKKKLGGPNFQWAPSQPSTPATGGTVFSMPGLTVKKVAPTTPPKREVVPTSIMRGGGW